jgi:D-threonate/D-erythronate kinase
MIGVIADDLTGAAELGAIAVRHGLRADIVDAATARVATEVLVFDTDSRSCDPEEAARRAGEAANYLRSRGACWIYKKTDSVLRGPITAEIAGVMRTLQLRRTLFVPANPSRGRIIRLGRYLVNGVPLNETEFRLDPEHARISAEVVDLLPSSPDMPVSVVELSGNLPPSGIAVGAVETPANVAAWARALPDNTLPAGGAEFFEALLTAQEAGSALQPMRTDHAATVEQQLFVCASTSESCRQFVAAAVFRGVPVFSLPQSVAGAAEIAAPDFMALVQRVAAALREHSHAILHVGLPVVQAREQAKAYASELVRVAAAVLSGTSVGQVCAEGGATAAALVRRMGWSPLRVLAELGPGVALLGISGGRTRRLLVKPGSYTWPEALLRPPSGIGLTEAT